MDSTIEIRAKVPRGELKNISKLLKQHQSVKDIEFYDSSENRNEPSNATRKNMYAMGLNPDDDILVMGNRTRINAKVGEHFTKDVSSWTLEEKRRKLHIHNRIEKGCPISSIQKQGLLERERRGMLEGEFTPNKANIRNRNMVM